MKRYCGPDDWEQDLIDGSGGYLSEEDLGA